MKLLVSALNPIDKEDWPQYSMPIKVYCAIKAPVDLLFRLTIPVVDGGKPRDNWCQYLAIIQCVIGELFSSFLHSYFRLGYFMRNFENPHILVRT